MRAKGFRHLGIEQAHGARADDDDRLARLHPQALHAAHHRGHGLQEPGLCGGNIFGHFQHFIFGEHFVIREAAVAMEAITHRPAALFALTAEALAHQAGFAVPAAHEQRRNAVANLDILHILAFGADNARPLVPAGHREALMVAQTHPLLIVRRADIARLHLEQHIIAAHLGQRLFVHRRDFGLHNCSKVVCFWNAHVSLLKCFPSNFSIAAHLALQRMLSNLFSDTLSIPQPIQKGQRKSLPPFFNREAQSPRRCPSHKSAPPPAAKAPFPPGFLRSAQKSA